MKKFRLALLTALVIAIGVGFAWFISGHREAQVYADRPLHDWIMALNTFAGGGATLPFQELGTNEVTVLIKALEFREGSAARTYQKFRDRTWRYMPRWLLMRMPQPIDTETIGINALIEMATMENTRQQARPAVPVLIKAMTKDESNAIRGMAASMLGDIGVKNDAVIAGFITALQDKDPLVHNHAIAALEKLAPEAARKAAAN